MCLICGNYYFLLSDFDPNPAITSRTIDISCSSKYANTLNYPRAKYKYARYGEMFGRLPPDVPTELFA